MKNKSEKERGITLIALVITIIIMLILVTVSIIITINGELFDFAGKAVIETKTELKQEQEIANLQSEMTTDELIGKYTTDEGIANLIGTTWKFNENIIYDNDLYFRITGTVFNEEKSYSYTGITINQVFDKYFVFCWFLDANHPYENGYAFAYIPENDLEPFPEGWVWGSFSTYETTTILPPSMTITGGEDVENQDLINWLKVNASQVQ